MFVRAYLRASTSEQDASRARAALDAFAAERGLAVASWYVENESGARLERPELFRLLRDARPGDVLLIEQVDRLSRLDAAGWDSLKREIATRHLRIVALDVPSTWAMAGKAPDEFTDRVMDGVNALILDVLAAAARKDYQDRHRRQAEGQARAKAEGRYRGRPEDTKRNAGIAAMLAAGLSWSQVQAATGCSRATVAKIAKRSDALPPAAPNVLGA